MSKILMILLFFTVVLAAGCTSAAGPVNTTPRSTYQTAVTTQMTVPVTTRCYWNQYSMECQDRPVTPDVTETPVGARADELTITSPTTQQAGAVFLAGTANTTGNKGVIVQIDGSTAGRVFGPGTIHTQNGSFSQTFNLTRPDTYTVQFTDYYGRIASVTLHVI